MADVVSVTGPRHDAGSPGSPARDRAACHPDPDTFAPAVADAANPSGPITIPLTVSAIVAFRLT
jgi:hypothetical protein